jgi:phosphatidate cytidylyltransferase
MALLIYLILFTWFFVGAIVTEVVNRKKSKSERRHNRLKYFTYFVIVNILFASILFDAIYFRYLSIVIILMGYFELLSLIFRTGKVVIGLIALSFFSIGFWGLFKFSFLDQHVLLFVVLLVTVFDAFSQLTGQLLGKRKLLPLISPNKTVEGLIGGYVFVAITAVVIREILTLNVIQSIAFGTGISSFAFFGDISASMIKRQFGVKDYSHLIPGHGGFLDRFDSLIFSGLFMYAVMTFIYA